MKKYIAIATLLGLAACGGGGGGGTGTVTMTNPTPVNPIVTPDPVVTPDPIVTPDPVIESRPITGTPDTTLGAQYLQDRQPGYNIQNEYNAANVTGLETVHSEGWTGEGINIGIVDDGFSVGQHGHATGYTAETVAPGATFTNESYSDGFINTLTNQDVINHSWGLGSTQEVYGYTGQQVMTILLNELEVSSPGALNVIAAPNTGNRPHEGSSTDDSGVIDGAGAAYLAGDLDGTYIFVGAHDSEYTSVPLGSLANDGLVADGTDVFTESDQGTSFAAPKVTGAAALIMHKFGTSAETTKDILLNTADDSFTGYSQNQHGHGMLDVGAAMSPVGNLN